MMLSVKEKVNQNNAWISRVIESLTQECEHYLDSDVEIPLEPGGWWHQYVCPTHHTELLFDSSETNPAFFLCPHGCRLTGKDYHGAWLVFKHQWFARLMLQASALYQLNGDERYKNLAKSIFLTYARQYKNYPENPNAQPWMLKGRVFHQALTEAIWVTTLFRGVQLLNEAGETWDLDWPDIEAFLTELETSMIDYRNRLIAKDNVENNYTAWLNAALASIYALQNDSKKMSHLIEDTGGYKEHLNLAIYADQLEFEGSVYYHVFVLRAYFITCEMAAKLGFNLYDVRGKQGQSLSGMLKALVDLSNDDGELPALHDGPYRRQPYAREIVEVFEIGYQIYKMKELLPVLGQAYDQLYGKRERAGLEALIYGSGDVDLKPKHQLPRESRKFSDTGFIVGRLNGNPFSFITDYGPHGGSHGHDDKLQLVLNHTKGAISPDLGMVPYGSSLRQEWFSRSHSHNTVTVGCMTHQPHQGECLSYETNQQRTYTWIQSKGAYEGSTLNRYLWLEEDWLLDCFTVSLSQAQDIHWWMNFENVYTDAWDENLHPEESLNAFSGIEAKSIYRVKSDNENCIVQAGIMNTNSDNDKIRMVILAPPQSSIYQYQSPGTAEDPSVRRSGICQRQFGTVAKFVVLYCPLESSYSLKIGGSPNEILLTNGTKTKMFRLTEDGLTGISVSNQSHARS